MSPVLKAPGKERRHGPASRERVASYFDSHAAYWDEIYDSRTVRGAIYRDRAATVLLWIDRLGIPAASAVLEVGCGSGWLTVELARRGYLVEAVDPSGAMIERTLRNVRDHSMGERVRVSRGYVESLPFPDHTFDLVVAIGVIPWVDSADAAVLEMARVSAAGGHVLLTSDNSHRLNLLLDPRWSPWTAPVRRMAARLKRPHRQPRGRRPSLYRAATIDGAIRRSGLLAVSTTTIGFGPFSMFGAPLLRDGLGIRAHHMLQMLADRHVPGLRSTGSHHVLLAQKASIASTPDRLRVG